MRNIIIINYFRNNDETMASNKYQGCDFDYITKTGEKLNNRRYTVRKPTFSQKQTAKEYK